MKCWICNQTCISITRTPVLCKKCKWIERAWTIGFIIFIACISICFSLLFWGFINVAFENKALKDENESIKNYVERCLDYMDIEECEKVLTNN